MFIKIYPKAVPLKVKHQATLAAQLKVGGKGDGSSGALVVCMLALDPGSLHGMEGQEPRLGTAQDRSYRPRGEALWAILGSQPMPTSCLNIAPC